MANITINGNKTAIKVGDHVRFSSDGEYFGVVKEVETRRIIHVTTSNGLHIGAEEGMLEVAPRLTPEQAWDELALVILRHLRHALEVHQHYGLVVLYPSEQRALRHECYKLLGGAGIKVDESVKERVRRAIRKLADAMEVVVSE